MSKHDKMMVSDVFRMVSDGPGHSRKVREGPGQKLKKVKNAKFPEVRTIFDKIQKCERFSTKFKSLDDFSQF